MGFMALQGSVALRFKLRSLDFARDDDGGRQIDEGFLLRNFWFSDF